MPHILDENTYDPVDISLAAKMHKAIAVIQFKLEGQLVLRHPEYEMEGRAILRTINFEDGTVEVDGKRYPLKDTSFPTVDPEDPLKLSDEEEDLIQDARDVVPAQRAFTDACAVFDLARKHVPLCQRQPLISRVHPDAGRRDLRAD